MHAHSRLLVVVFSVLAGLVVPARVNAQADITWANLDFDWGNGSNWIGGVVPGASDTAYFLPNFIGSNVNPFLGTSTFQLQNLAMFNGPLLSNYVIFSGQPANLTLAANSGNGTFSTRGIGNTSIEGPELSGSGATQLLQLNIGTSTTLTFRDESRIGSFQGNIAINGGTLHLDNSGSFNVPNRILNTGTLTITGGGTLDFKGNAAGTTTDAPVLSSGSNTVGGVNVIQVSSFGAATTLNFANTGAFSLRPGTRGVYHFVSTGSDLGDPTGGRVTFVGTPNLGANGLLANTAGGGTVGFAIATDNGGTDFATWNAASGVVRSTPTQTGTTAANLQSYTATDRVHYNQVNVTETATGTITNGSLRITPGTAGQTLAMGANPLETNALMIAGADDFTISSNNTVLFGATGTRYVYVNSSEATLTANGLVMANGTNPTVFAGPGFVDFTGTASQNTLSATTRFIVGGGTVRGTDRQIGFTSAGLGVISLVGGVLEIKNGTNGTGASADFTRPVGAAAGNVTWGAGTAAEQGSGGFSAFGSAASVNLGGAAVPANVQWGVNNFVGDGFALVFGSTKSNAPLTFQNPLQLDNGTNFQMREIRVIGGVGGDSTVMAGVISGNLSADLIKTGTGTLVLPAGVTHTYGGVTYVREGTLMVDGTLATAGAVVNVVPGGEGGSATLSGTGTINRSVNVFTNGTLKPGSSPGILTVGGNVSMNALSTFGFEYTGAPAAAGVDTGGSLTPGAAGNNKLEASGQISIDGSVVFAITGNFADFNPASTYSFLVASSTTSVVDFDITSPFQFGTTNFVGFVPDVFDLQWHNVGNSVYFNMVPVPEPMHILAVGFAAAGLGWIRRRSGKLK